MNKIPVKRIKQALSNNMDVAFAYIFGSSSEKAEIGDKSDLDIAVYFYTRPDIDTTYNLIRGLEHIVGENIVDLVVLTGCEDFILRREVLNGDLILCRDPDLHAAFFSWTLRMYEDQMVKQGGNSKQEK